MCKFYCLFFIFCVFFIYSQSAENKYYESLEKKLDDFEKNDEKALQYIYPYIKKAKQNNDVTRQVTGYRNALCFTNSSLRKLQYADSTIAAALRTKNVDLIGIAYLGKGIVYYSNFRNYRGALEEYLKANNYVKKSTDDYLRFKVIYQLGVVKSYLGYYDEASLHFQDCIKYFEKGIVGNLHPNELYNNQKGYLNSLHQLSILYRYNKQYEKADSLINIGLYKTHQKKEFQLERAYFKKCKGIIEYLKGDYTTSLFVLNKSIHQLEKVDDFTWLSVVYFYLGKNYQALNNKEKAISYFTKVDSIYNTQNFILPELLPNYSFLIDHYKNSQNRTKQIYYLEQLLKVDQKMDKDFVVLSSKIHKNYDKANLIEEKQKLKNKNLINQWIGIVLGLFSFIFLLAFVKYRNKEKLIQKNYDELQIKLKTLEEERYKNNAKSEINTIRKSTVPKEITEELLLKLKNFEDNLEYLQKGVTLTKLSQKFRTNNTYLSTVINEQKEKSFSLYLAELRINHITHQLNSEKKLLSYSTEGLAEMCGIGSRNNFSDLFYQFNGVKLSDFIRKRKAELGIS